MQQGVVLPLDQLIGLVDEATGLGVLLPALLDQGYTTLVRGERPWAAEAVVDPGEAGQLLALVGVERDCVLAPEALHDGALAEDDQTLVVVRQGGGRVGVRRHPVDVEGVLEQRAVDHRRLHARADLAEGDDALEGVRRPCGLHGEQELGAPDRSAATLVNEASPFVQ
jgi:hypothetical protein